MKPVKLYDLSQPIYHNCPGWPEYSPTVVTRDYSSPINGFNAETITLNTHTATHIDVPYHFFDSGKTIESFSLDAFSGDAVFMDLRGLAAGSPIEAENLKPFLDKVRPGDIAVLNTGWGEKRAQTAEYLFEWPYLAKSGAEALLGAGVKGVGIDALSLGGWGSPDKGRPCHEVLLGAGLFIIEELRIPEEVLDGKRRWFTAFPLFLQGCGGAPARAVLYEFE